MGIASQYRCEDCGHRFSASEDFSYGFSADVATPVVCTEHGLNEAVTGINLAGGDEITAAARARTDFPCPECGRPAPRWNHQSCPQCGGDRLLFEGQILWD